MGGVRKDMFGERSAALHFHGRPSVRVEDVILPAETLATINRQVVGVAQHRERLLAARQHLERGILLYGAPGVGKAHSVRYLTGQLAGVTIVQLTGDSLGLIGTACSVARTLQADVVFLLTTNRADVLEPALAARPGRVDQAVHPDLPIIAADASGDDRLSVTADQLDQALDELLDTRNKMTRVLLGGGSE